MAITKFTGATNTIQSLSDRPNQTDGLTATQLKLKFDQFAIDNKAYLNNIFTVEVDTLDAQNVKLTGTQTIAGVKTFSSSPIIPTPIADMHASTRKYVDDMGTQKTNDLNTHKTSSDHDDRYYTETEIASTTSGSSGASKVGMSTIAGIAGNDVQTVMANLLTVAQQAQTGAIVPGAITDEMLSNNAGQIKDISNNHTIDIDKLLDKGTSKTYYVNDATGLDTNDGLTTGTAFKTFNKARDLIPKFAEHTFTISIIGNYPSVVRLENKIMSSGGQIVIKGNTATPSSQIIAGGIQIYSCIGALTIKDLKSTSNIAVNSSIGTILQTLEPQVSGGNAVIVSNSIASVVSCNFGTSIVATCITASSQSTVTSTSNIGVGTSYGLRATDTSTIGKSSTQPTGTVSNENVTTGGVIR